MTQTHFLSVSSQIRKVTDFIVICHISSLFLSISVERRLEHVTNILTGSCTTSGVRKIRIWSEIVMADHGGYKLSAYAMDN